MSKYKKLLSVLCIVLLVSTISALSFAVEDDGENGDDYEYEDEKYEETKTREYQRLYYTAGVGGSYFVKRNGTGLDGNVGIYGNFSFRFSRLASIGFDTFYGWQFGDGNQYLSVFNPGLKIFPMMYKNPSFEPFIFIGGHAYDGVFGTNGYDRKSYGQGGFAGLGCRYFPSGGMMGIEFFVRASFLYFTRPVAAGGGRGLVIPVFSFIGIVY